METKEISREEIKGLEILAEGYKAIDWDGGTKGGFKYGQPGEALVGKVFRVDGDIEECKWGLHYCEDPANVFNFYEPLGYNRYFKVRAYEKCLVGDEKSVAQVLEFVEEYDMMKYLEKIKNYDRSVSSSNGVRSSNGVSFSNGVRSSYGVSYSSGVSSSNGVSFSNGVRSSYGVRKCEGIKNCLFCVGVEGEKHYLFNKKVKAERFAEVWDKIQSFCWHPNFDNWYDIKGHKEWWALCFPQLQSVDNDIAWSKMPQEMREYIFSLPEFNQKVWDKLTEK